MNSRSGRSGDLRRRMRPSLPVSVKPIGSDDPTALKVIGTFQIRLRMRQRLDGSLQIKCHQ